LSEVRVRFAPSPTGYLHIGGVRTALYNWLFARKERGKFILRIEDTDEMRSTTEAERAIIEGLDWLGLDWDEGPDWYTDKDKGEFGPYRQSQRVEKYIKHKDRLVGKGLAYYCYCQPDELKKRREEALRKGMAPMYDGRCRNLTEEEREKKKNLPKAVRFKNEKLKEKIAFDDMIRGKVEFDSEAIGDFVILKSSGFPTYNFAVVVDDYEMEITHIIRGDDHISNTPRQILLYEAFGWNPPKFAHVPMILGSDGARLSKRHGATAIDDFKKEGYLPEALLNYLVLLGWSTEDSQQIFEKDELIEKFSLRGCNKSSAIFDPKKLLWMNGEYVRKMSVEKLTLESFPWILPLLEKEGLTDKDVKWDNLEDSLKMVVQKATGLEQEKIKLLKEVPGHIDIFFKKKIEYDEKAVNRILKKEGAKEILLDMIAIFERLENFDGKSIEDSVRSYANEKDIKAAKIIHPLRVAVSGRDWGPGLFAMLELLEKERVLKRIKECLGNI